MKIIKKCDICDSIMETTSQRISDGRGKYCSRKCQFNSLLKQKEVKCAICNKTFNLRLSRVLRTKRFYCSKICRIEGSKKYDSKRIVEWIKKRTGFDKQILGKSGKSISYDGYYVYNDKKIHRILMEKHIGRKLLSTEIVHHIDGNKFNNNISNLQIVSRSEHNKIRKFLKK